MKEHTPFFLSGGQADSIIPATNGSEILEQHQGPLGAPEMTDEVVATLSGVRKVLIADLSKHTDVDPELKASVDPYPGLKSKL